MAKDIIIGLDVGTSTAKIVVAKSSGNELHVLAAGQKPASGLRRGYVVDPDLASEAIRGAVKEAERISNASVRHAYLSIGGIKLEVLRSKGMVIVSRADNEISENDVKRTIAQSENNLSRIANRTIIHTLPFSYKIDGETVFGHPVGMKGEKLEVETLFVASSSQHLAGLVKSADLSGMAVDDIIAGPLASSSILLTKRQKEVGAVLVDIGAETTGMAVFEEGNLLSLEVLAFGSNHITNDIALGLQISLEEAEDLKLNYVSDNQKKKITDIIEARLDDIFELIENHLKKIGRSGLLPAGVILTGGGANLANIEEFTKNYLKLPAKVGSPVIPLKIFDKQIHNPKWSTALGLCILGSGLIPIPGEGSGTDIKKTGHPLLRWLKSFLP
jgi:cell division protein FtsA